MRKLREAALLAATVGSVSMLGTGVASAHGGGEAPPKSVTINCNQSAGDDNSSTQIGGLITVTGPLLIGNADSRSIQQICGVGNEDIENSSGDSTGGTGTAV